MNYMFYTARQKKFGSAILAAAALSLAACGGEPTLDNVEADVSTPTEQADVPAGAEVGEGSSDVSDLIGETVTVSTEITEVISPNIFTVYDIESLRGAELLAITNFPIPEVGTNIEVTGEILDLDEAAIKAAYDVELAPEVAEAYAGRPYLSVQALEAVD
ncbi:hypothetical protein [cf. Phormidesmis sp. LEGE 11477]|uniref:hypothetical protein n=1 Tax=cf. Phormidesmis sp. LEGE 11477 TaxID=1828680 RepID=UPI0018810516|nr:hypothetical protein [cf. Phormidesmis sp. LEGE 11477]MBE9059428.1 hypothetical protein [cf. Phormidesmis sp. LEGE 11477]